MRFVPAGVVGLAVALAFGPAAAARKEPAPATDCGDAKGKTERLVCSTPALKALDDRMERIYRQAQDRAGSDARDLAHDQRDWRHARGDCKDEADPVRCLTRRYKIRIAYLQARWSLVAPASRMTFRCAEHPPVQGVFYKTDPSTARFAQEGRTWWGVAVETGSGLRYVDDDHASFWNKGRDLYVELPGERAFTCAAGGR